MMDFKEILDEELNTQFVNKELMSLDTLKKQLDAKIAENPMVGKELGQTVMEIDKKITGLKYAIAEYSKRKQMEDKTGVGTQKTAVAVKPMTTAPAAVVTTKPV
jgi:hypothetical protein